MKEGDPIIFQTFFELIDIVAPSLPATGVVAELTF
jgi:hypothetical protein